MRTPNPKVDYGKFLDAMWELHKAPRAADAPTVISTFAGCGGSSLGYSMAGFHELLAVEWDGHAVECFKLNFPGVPVYHGDISKLSVEDVLSRTGLKPGELDVFDGSPPCQGFSTAGKRNLDDNRNQLFREYVRLIEGLRPKVFVMENVSGMVKGKMKLLFAEILRTLKACGYQVSARLLNAMYFNVPQSRERMIFIGVRNDLGIMPSHPGAQGSPINVVDALERIGNATFNSPLAATATAIWKNIRPGQKGTAYRPGYYMSSAKIDPTKPGPTIPKIMPGTGGLMHWSEQRSLTIEEAKRLGSFPDGFRLRGKFVDQWARIGNSVPPLMMKAVAEHIRRSILVQVLERSRAA